jgi:hypothetical protein
MLGPHVSRTEQRGVVTLEPESGVAPDEGGHSDDGSVPNSAVRLLGLCATFAVPEAGCPRVAESERRRLMDDIMRLMASSPIPEATRVAGLTLIGWLARRRTDEAPHTIGIPEARESERRLRAKAR